VKKHYKYRHILLQDNAPPHSKGRTPLLALFRLEKKLLTLSQKKIVAKPYR
jgi:hypothetical protein